MLINIAWRNIWRHPLRSMVIFFSVLIGISAGIFILGFYWGMSKEMVNNAIKNEISHLQIHNKNFKPDMDIKFGIPNGTDLLKSLVNENGVKYVTGRFVIIGMATSPYGSTGIKVNGIMPDLENNVTELNNKIIEGFDLTNYKTNSIVIGKKLADKMKISINSKIIISFENEDYEIVNAAFRVTGIYQTQNTPYDASNVFVNYKDINQLINSDSEINEIAIVLDNSINTDIVADSIKEKVNSNPDLLAENWKDLSPELNIVVSSFNMVLYIFLGIIMIGLAFGVINTMLMSVLERSKEIGMMKAIGMNNSKLFFMILSETVFLVLFGCPFGLLLGYFLVSYFGSKGVNLSLFSEGLENFGLSSIIYPELEINHYLITAIFICATAILSSIYPSLKALKVNITNSLRKI